jgi:hypothetical protein
MVPAKKLTVNPTATFVCLEGGNACILEQILDACIGRGCTIKGAQCALHFVQCSSPASDYGSKTHSRLFPRIVSDSSMLDTTTNLAQPTLGLLGECGQAMMAAYNAPCGCSNFFVAQMALSDVGWLVGPVEKDVDRRAYLSLSFRLDDNAVPTCVLASEPLPLSRKV